MLPDGPRDPLGQASHLVLDLAHVPPEPVPLRLGLGGAELGPELLVAPEDLLGHRGCGYPPVVLRRR